MSRADSAVPRLRIRAALLYRLNSITVMSATIVGGGLVVVADSSRSIAVRVVAIVAVLGCLCFLLVGLRRPAITIGDDTMTITSTFRTWSIRFDEIVEFGFMRRFSRGGFGHQPAVALTTGFTYNEWWWPLFASDTEERVMSVLATVAPHVRRLKPERTSRGGEQFVRSRGPGSLERIQRTVEPADPVESLRAVRKVSVGPWLIQVTLINGSFVALTRLPATGEVIRRGVERARLSEAMEDGIAQVASAQAALAAGEVPPKSG